MAKRGISQSNILQMLSGGSLTKGPLVLNSFENEWDMLDDNMMVQHKQKKLAQNTLQNPAYFWSNNGIAYEIIQGNSAGILSSKGQTSSAIVSREQIRRKLDVLLYNVSRRIRYVFSQNFEIVSLEFADMLCAQIIILNTYLED